MPILCINNKTYDFLGPQERHKQWLNLSEFINHHKCCIQLTSPLPSQTAGQDHVKRFEMFNNSYIKNCPLKCTSNWFKLWEGLLMAALTSKLEFQGFLWRIFYSQRSCIANPTLIAPITPKIQASKILYYVVHCTKEYVKEKEKKMTVFTKYHGDIITSTSDCLLNNTLVY